MISTGIYGSKTLRNEGGRMLLTGFDSEVLVDATPAYVEAFDWLSENGAGWCLVVGFGIGIALDNLLANELVLGVTCMVDPDLLEVAAEAYPRVRFFPLSDAQRLRITPVNHGVYNTVWLDKWTDNEEQALKKARREEVLIAPSVDGLVTSRLSVMAGE